MKKILFTLILSLCLGIWVMAQSAELSLISSSGEESIGSELSLQWTLGDFAVEANTSDRMMLTEGFIQPILQIVEIPEFLFSSNRENSLSKIDFNVWPSPVTSTLNIDVVGEADQGLLFNLLNIEGRLLLSRDIDQNIETNTLDLSTSTSGKYIIQFTSSDGTHLKSFIIIKI